MSDSITIRKDIIRKVFLSMGSKDRAQLKTLLTADETLVLAEALDVQPGEEINW